MMVLLELENDRRTTLTRKERLKKFGNQPYIDIEAAKQDLIAYAEVYYNDITPKDSYNKANQKLAESQADDKFGRFFHSVIKPFYQQYRPGLSNSELEQELQLGRHFANLKVDPYAVATLSRHKVEKPFQRQSDGKTHIDAVELELPMVELTQDMVDDLQAIINNRCDKEWYQGQSDLARALIKYYAPRLIAGAMIPAQLIYHLIGTRNGYEKWTAVKPSGNKDEYKVLNKAYHAGSQAHLLKLPNLKAKDNETKKQAIKRVRNQAVAQTLQQLGELTDADHLSINTLVTSLGNLTHEKRMSKQILRSSTQLHTEERTISFSNVPQNTARRLRTCNLTGLKELQKEVNEFLTTKNDDVLSYQQQIKAYQRQTKDQPVAIPAPEILELYRSLTRFNAAIANHSGLLDPNNNNLEIASQANLLVHALNMAQDDQYYVLISGCFSGQDRGGMVSTHTSNEAITNYLIKDSKDTTAIKAQRATVEKVQAIAAHTPEMAGNAGTGFGGEGIKMGSKGIIPKYYPRIAKRMLAGSKTADYNEHLPKNPDRPFYKKKSFWSKAALCLTIVGIPAVIEITLHNRKKRLSVSKYQEVTTRTTDHYVKAVKPAHPYPNDNEESCSEPVDLSKSSSQIKLSKSQPRYTKKTMKLKKGKEKVDDSEDKQYPEKTKFRTLEEKPAPLQKHNVASHDAVKLLITIWQKNGIGGNNRPTSIERKTDPEAQESTSGSSSGMTFE